MKQTVNLVEEYAKAQGLWASEGMEFTDTLSLDISHRSSKYIWS